MAETAKLSADELTDLVSHMTAGDFWRFTELSGNAQTRALMTALHRVAVEQGLTNGEAVDVFLDRVEISELLKITGGSGPLQTAAGARSRISATTGE